MSFAWWLSDWESGRTIKNSGRPITRSPDHPTCPGLPWISRSPDLKLRLLYLACVALLLVLLSPAQSSSDGKNSPIQGAPAGAAATPSPAASPQPVPTGSTASQGTQAGAATQPHPSFLVLIDPSHGGSDQGALLPDKLLEKDITLAMARRLKTELEDHGIAARLVRDGDTNLSLEQRAEMANGLHAGIYIAIHAGLPGSGIRIYSPAMASATEPAGKFQPWESAQSPYVGRSQALAQTVAEEVGKKQIDVVSFRSSLRPLNNITLPAIAIELAPDPVHVADLSSQKFQTNVAAGIVSGIAQARTQLEMQK